MAKALLETSCSPCPCSTVACVAIAVTLEGKGCSVAPGLRASVQRTGTSPSFLSHDSHSQPRQRQQHRSRQQRTSLLVCRSQSRDLLAPTPLTGSPPWASASAASVVGSTTVNSPPSTQSASLISLASPHPSAPARDPPPPPTDTERLSWASQHDNRARVTQHHGHGQRGGYGGQQEAAASGRDWQHLPRRLTALLFDFLDKFLRSLTGEMPGGIKQPSSILRERSCVCDHSGSGSTSKQSFRRASKKALHRRGTQTSVNKTARGVESASKNKKPVAEASLVEETSGRRKYPCLPLRMACRFRRLPQQQPTAAVPGASAPTEAHSESDEFHFRYPDIWFAEFVKKVCFNHKSISLFARTTMETAARAGVSFRAAIAVAPIRTFKTAAIRKDEANKEDSIHVVHYENGQRREHDIEVDETKLVITAVQDVEITLVSVAALELVTDKAGLGTSRLPGNGVEEVCRQLAAEQQKVVCAQFGAEQQKDGWSWGLCLKDGNGAPIRVLSPQHDPDGFKTYFDGYIDSVWQHIANKGIKFDTQDGNPLVSCHAQDEAMYCDRTSRTTRPS